MPPRAYGRGRGAAKAKAAKQPAKGAGKGKSIPGTPSTMLMQILDELDLTFDPSVGLLQGENVIDAPATDVLLSVQKTLKKLVSQLGTTIANDEELLRSIDSVLKQEPATPPKPTPGRRGRPRSRSKAVAADETDSLKETLEDEESSDDERPAKRRRKRGDTADVESPQVKSEAEDVKEEVKLETEGTVEPKPASDDDDDLDAVPEEPLQGELKASELLKDVINVLDLYFEEEPENPEDVDDDYKRRKFGVAVFPRQDLKDMLPGEIPDIDFSKNKPPTQIPFTTFQSYVEPYFRQFTDEDIKLLKQRVNLVPSLPKDYDDRLTPFIIPKLGPFYGDVWAEEDNASGKPAAQALAVQSEHARKLIAPRGSADDLTDETLETEEVSCGPLASRLLSAILQEDDISEEVKHEDEPDEPVAADSPGWKTTASVSDYNSLEQRLKRELKYIGVYMNVEQTLRGKEEDKKSSGEFEEDWITGKEDDEVCVEIRKLQKELKAVTRKNQKRKERLIPIIEEQIAWQEYMSILEDLDKQVEQAYRRRITVPHKKAKKRGPGAAAAQAAHMAQTRQSEALSAQQQAANSGFRALLDKRAKWIEKIGPLFKSQQEMRRMPKESVFRDVDLSGDNDDDEIDDNADEALTNSANGHTHGESEPIPDLQ